MTGLISYLSESEVAVARLDLFSPTTGWFRQLGVARVTMADNMSEELLMKEQNLSSLKDVQLKKEV